MRPIERRSRRGPARRTLAVAMATLFVIHGHAPLHARTEAAQLTPRVDTLWTKTLARLNYMAGFNACALGGDPQVLIVAGPKLVTQPPFDHLLLVIDPMTGDTVKSVPSGHTSDETDMHFAARANVFATADYGTIKLWRWPELELMREFRTPSDHQNRFLITTDGRRLYSNIDGVMYDTETGDTLWQLQTPDVSSGTDVRPAMTADDSLLVTVRRVRNRGELALVVDVRTGTIVGTYAGGNGASWVAAVDISDDGRYVAVSRTKTNERGVIESGSCVVYDRANELIASVYALDGSFTDGKELGFVAGSAGLMLLRNGSGFTAGHYFFSMGNSTPSAYWQGYFYPRFSFDGRYHYGRSGGGGTIWLGRFDLAVASVASDLDAPTTLHPNPVDGTLTLTGLACTDGAAHAEVIDMTGRRLLATPTDVTGGSIRLDVGTVPAGTHLLRLQRDGRVLHATSFTKR